MDRRLLGRAAAGLVLFAVWTLVVSAAIAAGGRPSVQISSPFGRWPPSIHHVQRSSDTRLSIFATYRSTDVASTGTTSTPTPALVGEAGFGTTVGPFGSNTIDGTRFTTGTRAGVVESMSVYVTTPIDSAPNDRFALAIYSDEHGAPGARLATTGRGLLVGDAWNTLAIDVVLRPATAYWLMYNTNGSISTVNNAAFVPVPGNGLDDALHTYASDRLTRLGWRLTWFGNNLPMASAIVLVGLCALRRRRRAAAVVLGGFAASLLIALALREVTFAPYGLYPSGHALRTTYVAAAAAYVLPRRVVRVVGPLFVLLVTTSLVYTRDHYADEIIGGVLLGWSMATMANALAPASVPRDIRARDRVSM